MNAPSSGLPTGMALNLKRLMREREIGLRDLAERSELEEERLVEILDGDSEAGAIEAMQLAAALRAEPAELFAGIVWTPLGEGRGEYRMVEPTESEED